MLVACGQTNNTKDTVQIPVIAVFNPTHDWKTLEQDNYSIKYPSNWELDQSGRGNTLFILMSPLELDSDRFRENINLVTEDLTGKGVDLEGYGNYSLNQVRTHFTDFKLLENKKMKVGSSDYYKLLYTASSNGMNIEIEQWLRIENEKAYVLTLALENGKYDKFKETGENIMSTFTIKS